MKHKPRKRFGQNFLVDQTIIQRIVDSINTGPGQTVVEIGPGQGALTLPLLETGCDLHVIEIDRDLVAKLRLDYPVQLNDERRFFLHQADALRADIGEIAGVDNFKLVGNLPYNISTPLIFHTFTWRKQISEMLFMLQKEVVNRMAASAGDGKTYGRLSVMTQYYCKVEPLFTVPPGAFFPPPQVHSSIVRLIPYYSLPVKVNDEDRFDKIVKAAFGMRRKTLRNALKLLMSADEIIAAGIQPSVRAEQLTLEEFAALANHVCG